MRFINLMPADRFDGLRAFRVTVEVGGEATQDGQVLVRVQRTNAGFDEIIHVVTHTEASAEGETPESGVLLDVDVVSSRVLPNFWRTMAAELEAAHHECKRIFFSLLTDDTLSKLGPSYE